MKKTKFFLVFIFFGYLISNLISFYYINNFDKYEAIDTDDEYRHYLIKGVNSHHWSEAYKLKNDLQSGKSFFSSGDIYSRNYLPSKINLFYSIITKDNLFEKKQNKLNLDLLVTTDKKKIILLIFQATLFYCSIIFLLKSLVNHIKNLLRSIKIYKINKKNIRQNIFKLITLNISKKKKYNHLFRVAVNNKMISISLRKRLKPKSNFYLKLIVKKQSFIPPVGLEPTTTGRSTD